MPSGDPEYLGDSDGAVWMSRALAPGGAGVLSATVENWSLSAGEK
jgi:hypothetical protein